MDSLKRYMQRKKLTQKDLAAQLDISDAQISRIVHGQRGATSELLLRISDVTRIPLKTLLAENRPDGRVKS